MVCNGGLEWRKDSGHLSQAEVLYRKFRKDEGKTVRLTDGRWNEILTHAKSVIYRDRLRHRQVSKQPGSIPHQQIQIPDEESPLRPSHVLCEPKTHFKMLQAPIGPCVQWRRPVLQPCCTSTIGVQPTLGFQALPSIPRAYPNGIH